MYNHSPQRGRNNDNNYRRPRPQQNRGYNRNRFGSNDHNAVFSYIKRATTTSSEIIEIVNENTFPVASLDINQKLMASITAKGFTMLTPIQEKAIPAILDGQDVIGIANTGTGKTAAFLIPILEQIIRDHSTRAIIVAPTRELALQIEAELHSLSRLFPIRSTVCIGQSSMRQQINGLRRSPEVVVGTPGRILDLIKQRYLNISTFSTVVLDEVDQMLDMGFINDIKKLISFLPIVRQSLFFSATINPNIKTIINSFTKDPISISVKTQETTSHIRQDVVKVQSESHKVDTLIEMLRKPDFKKVIVFGQTKHGVEKLTQNLFESGFKVTSLHGNKSQSQRQAAIRYFKEDVVSIMVATDVAARGLDINNISHVINFDPPENYENYIHRIGRTGRAQKEGTALTFVRA